ncbi:hypothetical protein ACSFA0_12950 [Variovorax sp. LT1P1]|uniref:hypothetical protein n=1 Tax=Variovorax sp. LT1P1 TaxID=3443730 RepID=UPI003F457A3A
MKHNEPVASSAAYRVEVSQLLDAELRLIAAREGMQLGGVWMKAVQLYLAVDRGHQLGLRIGLFDPSTKTVVREFVGLYDPPA